MTRTVVIVAAGSRGDVQPCLALAGALARQGDRARVLASARYADLVRPSGPEFRALPGDPAEILESEEGQELLAGRGNPVAFVRNMSRLLRPRIGPILARIQAGAEGADLVVAPSFGLLGAHLGEYLRVPHVVMHFQPSQPTTAFPHPLAPAARFLGGLGNRISFEAVDTGSWLACRAFVNRWRREDLGLAPLPALGPVRRSRRTPVLCAFSGAVVPTPRDWGPNVHVTGFWHHERPDWRPPRRLLSFLADGPAPVYVGFGSMRAGDPGATDRLVRTALRSAGLRGVLAGDPATGEDDMLVVGDTPHDWLFPRMAAVVHHGGAGTTATALRAGVPSLVCPFFGDQVYWGERVHRLGAGPEPLPAQRLDVGTLTRRLRALTGTPSYAAAARRLGRTLSGEDGAARACHVLNGLFDGTRRPS